MTLALRLAAILGLLLSLSSCLSIECNPEYARPQSRVRFCGP